MKASQLIEALQAAIAAHGDREVHTLSDEYGYALDVEKVALVSGEGWDCLVIGGRDLDDFAAAIKKQAMCRAEHIQQQEAVFAQMRKEGRIL
jgi:hypothetical protein